MDNKNYIPTLEYFPGMEFTPIPPSEMGLQTVVAEPWVKILDHPSDLEGLHFNRDGSMLYLVQCKDNLVCKVDKKTKEVSVVLELGRYAPEYAVSAVKIHKDGRIFVACVNPAFDDGGIIYINADGSGVTKVAEHIVADDMVFDSKGGIYVTDMRGLPTDQTGAILYITPDYKERHTVFGNLATPNGIALSTDEKILWVTDTMNGNLIRTELTDDGMGAKRMNQSIVYRTTGFMGPDSLMVDNEDNVYCALYHQGRVLVFNKFGWPIGQVIMPGRAQGQNIATTHPMICPGTRELYICTNDDQNGAWILRAGSFAEANKQAFYLK